MSKQSLVGVFLRLLSVFLMSSMAAAVHAAAKELPIGQIMFWRSAIALLPIISYAFVKSEGVRAILPPSPGLHVTRGAFGAWSMALSFVSLAYLPVANAQAIAYLAPVLTIPMAIFFLGERVSKGIVLCVCLGFSGGIFMLWDTLEAPRAMAWLGIAAAFGYALTMAFVRVHIKKMTSTETPVSIAFSFAAISCAVGLATCPLGWETPSPSVWVYLCLAGLLGGAGHIVSSEAVSRAPVSVLAPFDYTGLIWALAFDLLLFSVAPTSLAWIGIVLVALGAIGVTLFSSRR